MALFSNPFFKSKEDKPEDAYSKGVLCLQNSDCYGANKFWSIAAEAGHVSALYNLALLNGGAHISPLDIDLSVGYFRRAAEAGHPKAQEYVTWIDKAEDTSFGTKALAMFARQLPAEDEPNHLLMMVGCSLYEALCRKYSASDSVIGYELDAASNSDHRYIQRFIKRTGIEESFYEGAMDRHQMGSPADQITDGLNDLFLALKHSGHSDKLCLMIRCTIVGYVISKSNHADGSAALLGVDKFFQA